MSTGRKKIGQLLVESGLIGNDQLRVALEKQKTWGKKLGETLVALRMISEKKLVEFLSKQFKLPAVDLDHVSIDSEVAKLVTPEFCKEHHLIPLAFKKIQDKSRLIVATADPGDFGALDQLQFKVNVPTVLMVTSYDAIERAIARVYYDQDITPREDQDQAKPAPTMSTSNNPSLAKRFKVLVKLLVRQSVLTEEEGNRLLEGLD